MLRLAGFEGTDLPPQALTWCELLESRATLEQLLGVVKDFMATIGPEDLAALPQPCRPPGRFWTASDLSDYAFTLVQHQCGLNAENEGARRLANFFSSAAARAAVLSNEATRPTASSPWA